MTKTDSLTTKIPSKNMDNGAQYFLKVLGGVSSCPPASDTDDAQNDKIATIGRLLIILDNQKCVFPD